MSWQLCWTWFIPHSIVVTVEIHYPLLNCALKYRLALVNFDKCRWKSTDLFVWDEISYTIPYEFALFFSNVFESLSTCFCAFPLINLQNPFCFCAFTIYYGFGYCYIILIGFIRRHSGVRQFSEVFEGYKWRIQWFTSAFMSDAILWDCCSAPTSVPQNLPLKIEQCNKIVGIIFGTIILQVRYAGSYSSLTTMHRHNGVYVEKYCFVCEIFLYPTVLLWSLYVL